jgi:hypothetical protein
MEQEDGEGVPTEVVDEMDLLSYMLGLPAGARRVRRHYSTPDCRRDGRTLVLQRSL